MEETSIPTIEEIVIDAILVIFSVVLTFLLQRWFSKKGEKLAENADVEIKETHNEIVGELRQGDRSKVIIINQPTYAIRELPSKPITILKRERKTKSVLRSEARKKEISGVKFTYLRDITDNTLEHITWLHDDFSRAIRAAIAYYTSDSVLDETKYSQKVVQYFREMKDMHENDRLTHLLVPRIMIIDGFEISSLHKWVLLESYYRGVQQHVLGNMLFVAEKDPQVYVDRLIHDHVEERNLDHIIIEARGSNINNASEVANRFISDNKYGWFITRTDFCLHHFIEEAAPKIWVEMSLAPEKDQKNFEQKQNETRDFIDYLIGYAEIRIEQDHLEKQARISVYEEMHKRIESFGYAVLVGFNNYVYSTLRLASTFRIYNPQFDYVADLDSLDPEGVRIAIIFSSQEIGLLYRDFLAKRSNSKTEK